MTELLLLAIASGMTIEINGKPYLLVGCPQGEAVGVFHKSETGFRHVTTLPMEVDYEFSEKDESLLRQVVTRLETEAARKAA